MRLPATVADLRGLRAARWIRESTVGQADRYGPDAQRDQQDRALERYGLVDTELAWSVAHSGRTVGTTAQFAEMLELAGRQYDVLVVGYVSRFARNLRTAVNARHDLHARGAVILFADEQVLSSDEDAWETWAREAVEAEAYSRRLGKRIREGYAAKFRRLADPGGRPPLGFLRTGPARTLVIDPDTIGRAVAIFERYATGTVSIEQLAHELDLRTSGVQEILRNPLYNGWAGRGAERVAASWRPIPPVSDPLWARVEELRARRRRHGGSARPASDRVDLLRGLLVCVCGQRIRTDGTMGTPPRIRKLHPEHDGCAHWGAQASYSAEVWEGPVTAQVSTVRLDDATLAAVVAALTAPEMPPVRLDSARLDRRRRELALAFASGRLAESDFAAAIAALRDVRSDDRVPATVPAERAVAWLRDLARLWKKATPGERAELVGAIYAEIRVQGPTFVAARLTPDAYAHGLALALAEQGRLAGEWVLARPTGAKPAGAHWRIPIVDAADWRAAARLRRVG